MNVNPELFPYSAHDLALPAGTMRYVDEGEGAPIVFVHGTPAWSFLYRHAIRAMSPSHRCIAPDHLGFGRSDKPRTGLVPSEHAANLDALITHLRLRDITLVVHDFGGPIGLPYALTRPENVSRVVIMNTWMWATADEPAVARISRFVAGPLGRFLYRWLNASARWLLPSAYGDRRKLTKEIHRHYLAPFAKRADREGPWVLGRELLASSEFYASLWSKRARLGAVPIDILWGERDPAFGPPHLARLREAFPHARVQTLAHAGHFVAEEAPESLVAALRRRP